MTRDINCASTRKARAGDKVTVHYGGFLQDGECLTVGVCAIVSQTLSDLKTYVLQNRI